MENTKDESGNQLHNGDRVFGYALDNSRVYGDLIEDENNCWRVEWDDGQMTKLTSFAGLYDAQKN